MWKKEVLPGEAGTYGSPRWRLNCMIWKKILMLAEVLLKSPLHKNLSMCFLEVGVCVCMHENWHFTPILHFMFAVTFPIAHTQKFLQKKDTHTHPFGQCSCVGLGSYTALLCVHLKNTNIEMGERYWWLQCNSVKQAVRRTLPSQLAFPASLFLCIQYQ